MLTYVYFEQLTMHKQMTYELLPSTLLVSKTIANLKYQLTVEKIVASQNCLERILASVSEFFRYI
jgi:hypothetical protein